jgi:hypothetical protein
MQSKLVSLFKYSLLSVAFVAASAQADYYMVYSESECAADSVPLYSHHYRHHSSCHVSHHRYHRHWSRHYRRPSTLDMKVYYVWQVFPTPGCPSCGGCEQQASPCRHRSYYYDAPCNTCAGRGHYVNTDQSGDYNNDERTVDDTWP